MLFILALDGVPCSLLKRLVEEGLMPHTAELLSTSFFSPMHSVLPPVSSSAWASFMTGFDPIDHGILGFVDRDPQTLDWFVPNRRHLRKETVFEILSKRGANLFSMNVPLTYPPPAVNGILISGFLAPDIEQATYPPMLGKVLKARGYRLDSDVQLAKREPGAFLRQLEDLMAKRFEIAFYYLDKRDWDLYMVHIMETDRLHHFFWHHMDVDDLVYAPKFRRFYQKLDQHIGRLLRRLKGNDMLMMLSDHGFTRLRREVQLNHFLHMQGYLRFTGEQPESLGDLHPDAVAYSLYPGRIYFNLRGRERDGWITPGTDFERYKQEIKQSLMALKDPETGDEIIDRVITPGEWQLEQGRSALLSDQPEPGRKNDLPDLFVIANEGFDLKGNLWHPALFENTHHNGMHTFNDAFLSLHGPGMEGDRFSIKDVTPILYELLDQPLPQGLKVSENLFLSGTA